MKTWSLRQGTSNTACRWLTVLTASALVILISTFAIGKNLISESALDYDDAVPSRDGQMHPQPRRSFSLVASLSVPPSPQQSTSSAFNHSETGGDVYIRRLIVEMEHQKRQFLESKVDVSEESPSLTPSQGASAIAVTAADPLYPSSLEAYRHPFGTCRSGRRISVGAHAYESTKNFHFGNDSASSTEYTRFWPQFPDLRDDNAVPGKSEHERCHRVMARMLAIVASVLLRYNMTTWFVSHATLLGGVREGGFIPWDVDVDLAMPRSHLTFLRKYWRREFPRDMFLQTEKTDQAFHMWNGKERAIRIKDRYSNFAGMKFSVQKGGKRFRQRRMHMGAHIDIIPLEKRGGMYKVLHHYFAPDDVFPLGTVCFENMNLPAPRNISGYLRTVYGDDFMSPPKNATFGGPTTLPCFSRQRMRGNPWSLSWALDHPRGGQPKIWPRDDPDYGSFLSDYKTPHRLYYNGKW